MIFLFTIPLKSAVMKYERAASLIDLQHRDLSKSTSLIA